MRVAWTPGDLVLFDNRITQHYAPDDYGDLPRLLHRVTVAGDVPAGIDGTLSHVVEGRRRLPLHPRRGLSPAARRAGARAPARRAAHSGTTPSSKRDDGLALGSPTSRRPNCPPRYPR